MTAFLVAGALTLVAGLDGMFAGFRASCGRTGLVWHRRADLLAALRGLALSVLLLTPVCAVAVADVTARRDRLDHYVTAGRAMLAVYAPYGLVALFALVAYAALTWRHRFIATAVILGPFTLVRPLVAIAGALAAGWAARDLAVGLLAVVAAVAALAVEPAAGRRWYAARRRRP